MMISNNSSHLSSDCAHFRLVSVNEAIAYLYFISFPISLLLNGIAAWVSVHLRSTSTFIVYLKNLVATDLLMILTTPLMAASMLPRATLQLKVLACRFSNVILYCCLYTSIAFMGLISLDRFFKVVRPCGKVWGQSLAFSAAMSTLVWVVLFGSTGIPTMILSNQDPVNKTGDFCMSLKSPAGVTLHKFVVIFMEILFFIVSSLIVFCYTCITLKVLQSFRKSGSNNSNGKKKTKLRVYLILLVFFVCFVPLHMMRIPFTLYEIFEINVCADAWVMTAYNFFLWLSTTNACLDPLLCLYLCREFKDKLLDMLKAKGIYSGEREETSQ